MQPYKNRLGIQNQASRAIWGFVWNLLFRFTPRLPGFWAWRRFLLRLFGAKVGHEVLVYPSARIWAPWNLELGAYSRIGPWTDIYSVGKIILGENAWVSQYAYLCTATHDIDEPGRELIVKPITIQRNAWLAADVYIGPGVTVEEGAVVGVRSSVFKNVERWTVVGGNPARFIKKRIPFKKIL